MPPSDPLVSPHAFAAHLGDPAWAVVDCRTDLTNPSWGRSTYLQEHIPGALHADLDTDLSAPRTGLNGRHPLPSPEHLASVFSRWGIDEGIAGRRLRCRGRFLRRPAVVDAALPGTWVGASPGWRLCRLAGRRAADVRRRGKPPRAPLQRLARTPSMFSLRRRSPAPAGCSMPAPRSATAARSSRWIAWPGTSPGRVRTNGGAASARMAVSCQPAPCGRSSRARWPASRLSRPSSTAAPA